jgi:hypothetical protein
MIFSENRFPLFGIMLYGFGQLGCWPHLGPLFVPQVCPNQRQVLLAQVMIRQPLPFTHAPSQSDSSTHVVATVGGVFGRTRISAAWLDAMTTPIAASRSKARSIARSRANQQTIRRRYRRPDSLRSFPAVCSQLLVDESGYCVVFRGEPGMLPAVVWPERTTMPLLMYFPFIVWSGIVMRMWEPPPPKKNR